MKSSIRKPPPPPGLPSVSQRIAALKLASRSHSSTKTFPGGKMLVLPMDDASPRQTFGIASNNTKDKKGSRFMPFLKRKKGP